MLRFAANLSMMFTEWTFLDRFGAAADAGFEAVEYLFPYDFDPDKIARRLEVHGLTQALFNMPPGDWTKGERGLAAIPGREIEFRDGVARALIYASATGAKRLHMMSGLMEPDRPDASKVYRENVVYAAGECSKYGIDVLLEPINGRNMPRYFMNDFNMATALIGELALPNVKLQFDVYHRQIIHGDVTMALRELMPLTGHVQIASVPSRHEPTTEELNDVFIFEELDRLSYSGFVGCEYNPRAGTRDGLGWFAPYRR